MSLPSGTTISILDIATELQLMATPVATFDLSLRNFSNYIGFVTPDFISEFWGLNSSPTPTPSISAPAVEYIFYTGESYSTGVEACSAHPTPDTIKYLLPGKTIPSVGDRVYNDSNYNSVFIDDDLYFYVQRLSVFYAIAVNGSGYISDVLNCVDISATPTSTITPTATPSLSISATQTPTPTVTQTPTSSETPTPTVTQTPTSPAVEYMFYIGETYSTGIEACIEHPTPNTAKYLAGGKTTPNVNDRVYNNSSYTETMVGDDLFYYVVRNSVAYALAVNGSGFITDILNCIDISSTPTPSVTPTVTPSLSISATQTPSITTTPENINVSVDNQCTNDSSITDVTVGGSSIINVSPEFPYLPSDSGSGRSPSGTGTYTIVVDISGTFSGSKYMNITDSNSVIHCQNVTSGQAEVIFTDVYMNGTGISIIFYQSGSCPTTPSITPTLSLSPTQTPTLSLTSTITPTPTVTPSTTPTNYYYIDEDGVDDAGRNGHAGEEWATLAYACTRVTTAGNTIFVNAGTYTETSQSVLACGVNIMGEGDTSIILSHYASSTALIYGVSISEGTDGNQSISYLKFDGDNYTGTRAIYFRFRHNVSIHHCTIQDFEKSGINIYSEYDWVTPPTIFSTGITIYNNTIYDNTENPDNGGECNLRVAGCTGTRIYNNTITNSVRVSGRSIYTSQVKDTKIYDNTFYCRQDIEDYWNFAMELFNPRGALEVYGNTIYGSGTIDVAGHSVEKGIYDYAAKVHDNDLIMSSPVVWDDNPSIAVTVEAWISIESVYVYNNYIKNFPWGINVTMGEYGEWGGNGTIDGLFIYNNIIENPANTDLPWSSFGIGVLEQTVAESRNNINICNNVVYGDTTYAWRGILYAVSGSNSNINIKNNIIYGFTDYGIVLEAGDGTTDDIEIDYNILYDCGNDNDVYAENTGLTYTNVGHIKSDPSFVSSTNFHLSSSSSPAYHAGVYVGLTTTDFDGITWNNPPSIGAYEYGVATTPTITPSLSISATRTPSLSISATQTPSLSLSPTVTPTISVSSTPGVPTPSLSISKTPSITPSTGTAPCASGLMGYWPLEEASGTIYDSTDNNIDSASQSVTYQTTGKINYGLSFNGTSNHVTFDVGDCQPTSALTISAWVKCGVLSGDDWIISNEAYYNSNYYGYQITVNTNDYWGFILCDGAGNETDQGVACTNIHDDNWHHICLTWNGSQIYAYSDGTQNDKGTWNRTIAYTTSGTSNPLMFGKGIWGAYYDGELDEVGIWNRALSAAEVAYLYNSGSGRSCYSPDASPTPTPSITPTLSISATRTPSLSISATQTPSLSVSATPGAPSVTPTQTRTPSITRSVTPSLSISKTPSISISTTQTPSKTPEVIVVSVDNQCTADSNITDVTVGGSSIINVIPAFPYYPSDSGSGRSPSGTGTYTVNVSISGTFSGSKHMNLTDSNSTIHCQNVSSGQSDVTYTNIYMNGTGISIIFYQSGLCPVSPSPTPSLSISATQTPSLSISATPSLSISKTPSLSISKTPSLSISRTPSLSISRTPTPTVTPSPPSGYNYACSYYSCSGSVCGSYITSGQVNESYTLTVGKWYKLTNNDVIRVDSSGGAQGYTENICAGPYDSCNEICAITC